MAVEHVLGMLTAGDTPEKLLQEYSFLEAADIQACLAYAHQSLSGFAYDDERAPSRGEGNAKPGRSIERYVR